MASNSKPSQASQRIPHHIIRDAFDSFPSDVTTREELQLYVKNYAKREMRREDVVKESLDEDSDVHLGERDPITEAILELLDDSSDAHLGWNLENLLWKLSSSSIATESIECILVTKFSRYLKEYCWRGIGTQKDEHYRTLINPNDEAYYCQAYNQKQKETETFRDMSDWYRLPPGIIHSTYHQTFKPIFLDPSIPATLLYVPNGTFIEGPRRNVSFLPSGYLWFGPLDQDSIMNIMPRLSQQIDNNILGTYWRRLGPTIDRIIQTWNKHIPNVSKTDFGTLVPATEPREGHRLGRGYFVPIYDSHPTEDVFRVGAGYWVQSENGHKLCMGEKTRDIVKLPGYDPAVYYMPYCIFKEKGSNEWYEMLRGYFVEEFGNTDEFKKNIETARATLQERLKNLNFEEMDFDIHAEHFDQDLLVHQILKHNPDVIRLCLEVLTEPGDVDFQRFVKTVQQHPLGESVLHRRLIHELTNFGLISAVKISYRRHIRKEIEIDCYNCVFTKLGFAISGASEASSESLFAASLLCSQPLLLRKCINFAHLDMRDLPDIWKPGSQDRSNDQTFVDALVWLVELESLELRSWILNSVQSQMASLGNLLRALKGGNELSKEDGDKFGSLGKYKVYELQEVIESMKRLQLLKGRAHVNY